MNYMTIKETAEKWNITERRVQILCRDDRMAGARKFGRDWAIPIDAEKPEDKRIKSGNYVDWRKKQEE